MLAAGATAAFAFVVTRRLFGYLDSENIARLETLGDDTFDDCAPWRLSRGANEELVARPFPVRDANLDEAHLKSIDEHTQQIGPETSNGVLWYRLPTEIS